MMLSPKKGAAAPAKSNGTSLASPNRQSSLSGRSSDLKTLQPSRKEAERPGTGTAQAVAAAPPSPASPKQTRSSYDAPGSPIASASKRSSGRISSSVNSATKAKPKAAAPVPGPSSAHNYSQGPETPQRSTTSNGAGSADVYHDHTGAGAGSETKNETLFSPAYLRQIEEQKRQEELKHAAAAAKAQQAAAKRKPTKTAGAKPTPAVSGAGAGAGERKAVPVAAPAPAPMPTPVPVTVTPPSAEADDGEDDYALDEDEFDPFLFIKNLPPLPAAMRNRKSPLPKKAKKAPNICLALDLDETLVHCSVQPIDKAELTFSVNFNGMDYEVYVRTRPYLKQFLEQVSEWFEVIVFTASQKVYADKLLNILDPKKQYIQHRVFRDSCVCIDGNYLKDLHILGRELKKTAIVDNSVQAFGFQLDNGIPIESWFDDDNDQELLNLLPFLKNLKDVQDVRPLIRQTFRLQEFVNSL